ncbi:MAG: DUF3300 domain-containing protein [Proteobacteria bacterium]|nr:DUF3300 domain-containing protein [Pseudomonadota bacterium]
MSSHTLPAAGAAGRRWLSGLQYTALGLAVALSLAACNKDGDNGAVAQLGAPASPAPEPQPVAYQPPAPEVLYRMVAPIALYPDKLVAQILAASTYPDQVSAAESWLGQNPGLKPAELALAANDQPWDPAVKSLTQFPNVLEQMASNLPWTTALGKAYYNDPADVMNAIQVMRGRAYEAGALKSSKRMQVRVAAPPANPDYVPAPGVAAPVVAPVIQAPPQFIEIAPSAVDTVYVPQYDPAVVYGAPLPLYTGYSYAVAPPLAVGLLGFGTAIVVAEPVWNRPWHRPWGWNSWGMHWGEPGRRWHAGEPPPPPMARPAVVYNNTTYVSRSTTVVNHTIHVGQPRPMPAVNAQPQPFGPHPGALGAAAVGGAALAAGALAQRPQPPVPHGGPGPWQQQPPAGQPPHLAGLVPPGQFRQPWQGGLQPGAGFAQRPSAPPGQGHAPAAESWSARQAGRNGVPQPQAQTAPVPPPQGAAAAHAPRPWMAQREQERMRVQAQPQALLPAQQRAQEQAHPQQAVMAQQRAQDQARQQQAVMAQQRMQEQARQQQMAMAQQRSQEQARQQQAAMAQQRAQQQMQMQQRQEMAQRQEMQRAQQFQQQQQQMAAARAREARPPERGGVPGQHEGRWR